MAKEVFIKTDGEWMIKEFEEDIIKSIANLNEEQQWCLAMAVKHYSEPDRDGEDFKDYRVRKWYADHATENPRTHGWNREAIADNLVMPDAKIEIPYPAMFVKFYDNEEDKFCIGYGIIVTVKDDEFFDDPVHGKLLKKYSVDHIIDEDGHIFYGVYDFCRSWYEIFDVEDNEEMVQKLLNTKPVYEAVQKVIDDENNKDSMQEYETTEDNPFDLPF